MRKSIGFVLIVAMLLSMAVALPGWAMPSFDIYTVEESVVWNAENGYVDSSGTTWVKVNTKYDIPIGNDPTQEAVGGDDPINKVYQIATRNKPGQYVSTEGFAPGNYKVEFRLYDDGTSLSDGFVAVSDGTNTIYLGSLSYQFNSTTKTEYVFRLDPPSKSVIKSGVSRSKGWHTFSYDTTGDAVVFQIDDTVCELPAQSTAGSAVIYPTSVASLQMGDAWANGECKFYLDDIKVTDAEGTVIINETGDALPNETYWSLASSKHPFVCVDDPETNYGDTENHVLKIGNSTMMERSFETPIACGVFSFKIYDDMSNSDAIGRIDSSTGEYMLFGVCPAGAGKKENYYIRIGGSTQEVTVPRSEGWHTVSIDYRNAAKEGKPRIYVDNTLCDLSNITGTFPTDIQKVAVGTLWNVGDFKNCMDDITITSYSKTTVPADDSKGLTAGILEAAGTDADSVSFAPVNGSIVDGELTGVLGDYSEEVPFTVQNADGDTIATGFAPFTAVNNSVPVDETVFDGWTVSGGEAVATEAKSASFAFYGTPGAGIAISTKIGMSYGRLNVVVKDSKGAVLATDKIDMYFPLASVNKQFIVSNTMGSGDGLSVTAFEIPASGMYTVEIRAEGVGYTELSKNISITAVDLNTVE